ncbi:hypothetical protein TrCOL_g3463 [Triparma columacea]|uniref:Phospholipid/glycerol acyltransferase domain-containing protein n=1 Tax=Triparma columacea TaxID=722753 RepID=A0A9W7LAQ6_9STRA|nr:hypothetical protein TrCOL_g3463 [Triparma columacea]
MAYNRLMSELDATKTQMAVLIVALFLAVDSINPMKIFLHVMTPLLGLTNTHVAFICVFLLTYLFMSEAREILYFSVKVFFHSILSIFFKEVEITGLDNIPRDGPVIFVGNHANQFVDGIMLMTTCAHHKVSFLVAEKSWNRRVIGDIAFAMGAVPVARAQDKAKRGSGKLKVVKVEHGDPSASGTSLKVRISGMNGCNFSTSLKVGDKIRPEGYSTAYKVLEVGMNGEDSLLVEVDVESKFYNDTSTEYNYEIFARVDQSAVYSKVLNKLEKGGCIGIFPEGGSHDRTDLLPLKVGVALIAYTALDKRGLNIPIVPVGLNYFNMGHFRGRSVVEYGEPIYLDPKTLDGYLAGGDEKKAVCNGLLKKIEDGMRSVIVTAPDYDTLKHVHVARRLWKRDAHMGAEEKQDLNRRFSLGLQQLLAKFQGNLPRDLSDFLSRIKLYQAELEDLGIKDYQVKTLDTEEDHTVAEPTQRIQRSLSYPLDEKQAETLMKDVGVPYRILHMVFTIILALIPAVLLNLPIGLLSTLYAERKRKKALANSKVKIKGMDVLLSEKVIFCIVMVPALWISYAIAAILFTNMDYTTITLVFVSMPIFSYVGIMATEAGMVDFKDLKPHIAKLDPSKRKRIRTLPSMRLQLVKELKEFVRKFGPTLGELYYEKDVDWAKVQRLTTGLKSPPNSPKRGAEKKKEK